MPSFRRLRCAKAALLLVAGLGLSPRAVAGGGSPDATAPGVQELIRRLGDDDFDERESASRALKAVGVSALPALESASYDDEDAEIRHRAACAITAIGARYPQALAFARQVLDGAELMEPAGVREPVRAEIVALAVKALYPHDERFVPPDVARELCRVRSMSRAELQLFLWSVEGLWGPRGAYESSADLDRILTHVVRESGWRAAWRDFPKLPGGSGDNVREAPSDLRRS